MSQIVICSGLEDGDRLVRGITSLVDVRDATIHLLCVIDDAEGPTGAVGDRIGLVRPRSTEIEDASAREVDAFVHELVATVERLVLIPGSGGVTGIVGSGRPERVIVDFLAQKHADLCVVGRRPDWHDRAESGPKSVGKVARFVIDHAPCPVLVFR
jgi:nucleotide-binding universal stress UspA family protein